MNVLITAPSLNEADNVSGISTIVRTIISNSREPVTFFHFKIGTKDGVKKGFRWATDQFTLVPRMAAFIRKNKIDAIHLNTDFTKASVARDFVLFSFLKHILKKPVLLHIHGGYMLMAPPPEGTFYRRMISHMLKKANVNVVLSHIEQKQLKDYYNAASRILPNAVEPFISKNGHRKFNEKIRFVFLGRIVKEKGIYIIAEAMEQLGDYHSQFDFNIYGSGPGLTLLLEQLTKIKTLEYHYRGVAKGIEKWQALEKADVFLLPSLFGEGMPIAMLEAMQSGCIPVVSDDASIGTVVENAVNGFIVKKGSPEELVGTLKHILSRPANLEQISDAAKTTIIKKYGISKYMESLTAYYSAFSN